MEKADKITIRIPYYCKKFNSFVTSSAGGSLKYVDRNFSLQ